jgi:lipopolysaccharide/colanic/teichoic acid biosynthesis glycosyltransferase
MKRVLDLGVAFVVFIATLPLFLFASVWVKLDSPGPLFYRALRVGRGGRNFRMLKFRSMVVNADRIGGPTTSEVDPRLTRSGTALRRFKLDELPQLLNVIRGDMSLVGPRPDVPSEVQKLSADESAMILSVRPGMTDWASIKYYDEGAIVQGHSDPHQAYEQLIRPGKIELQIRYAREASFGTDLRILLATAARILGRRPHPPV